MGWHIESKLAFVRMAHGVAVRTLVMRTGIVCTAVCHSIHTAGHGLLESYVVAVGETVLEWLDGTNAQMW